MNLLEIKRELLDPIAQIIIFDKNGMLSSSCNSIFSLNQDTSKSLYDVFPFLESLQEPLAQLKEGDKLEFKCMWFEYGSTTGFFDYKIIKKESMLVWLLQDFDKIYSKLMSVQQERNEFIITSEMLELLKKKRREKLKKIKKSQ